MIQLIRNRYFIILLLLYAVAVCVLILKFNTNFSDSVSVLLSFGILLPIISWLLVKNNPVENEKPTLKNEWILILALVVFFTWYVTFGTTLIDKLIPASITQTEWKHSLAILVKKVFVFVLIPYFLYSTAGFTLKDFGFTIKAGTTFSRRTVIIFVILSILIIAYQYFFSGGAKPVREGQFSARQLVYTTPLLFAWLFIEAGLVEEFFFRALLQSRISAILKSPIAGIVISGLIFGLAHAPGLYLRGAGSEGITEQLPLGFWLAYTISAMSLAGIFLGVVWYYTKNIFLVIALHAMVDLLPNYAGFIHTWHL